MMAEVKSVGTHVQGPESIFPANWPKLAASPFITLTGSDCERIITAGTEKLSCRVSQVRVTTDAQEWVRGR